MAKKIKKVKMKIRKSVRRRIKVTGTGKLLRRQSFGRHLKASKSGSRSRRLKRSVVVSGKFEKKLRNILGVG
ncbi:MAG: 50S ribosomal protein L35 [bacterium]|nr:50S ribosomal protein L35 [bacterium]